MISTITIVTSVISTNIITINYQDFESDGPGYTQQLLADITFHLCVNLTGWYLRYVCDINMRRGFLDKRGCIETTFRLKFEKEQEESLLLSIIPKHIASHVGDEIKKFIDKLKDEAETSRFRLTIMCCHNIIFHVGRRTQRNMKIFAMLQ